MLYVLHLKGILYLKDRLNYKDDKFLRNFGWSVDCNDSMIWVACSTLQFDSFLQVMPKSQENISNCMTKI